MSNGNDCVLLNYSGAMVTGLTGHTHNEQHQSTICAWYKAEHARRRLPPIVCFGYQVEILGEIHEPRDYEQWFDTRSAILHTKVTFVYQTVLDIEAFLTDSGVLVTSFTLESTSADDLHIAPVVLSPAAVPCAICLEVQTALTETADGVDFTYDCGGFAGAGCLRTDRAGWSHRHYRGEHGIGLRYGPIAPGWKMTAYVSCADAPTRPVVDFTGIREAHVRRWNGYFDASSVTVPDDELQYAYELSRYVVASMLHKGGALPVGHLPSLWSGGTCCPYDSEMMQLALLQGNNLAEGRHYVDFYLDRFDDGLKLAKSVGLKGFAFSNWSDVLGNHRGNNLARELTFRKSPMIGLIGIAAANARLYSGKPDADLEKLALACADFIECFIRDGHRIVDCAAGNESEISVSRDSFMLMVIIKLFEMCEALFGDHRRGAIAQELRKELLLNQREDGVIMPFANAPYTAGQTTHVQYYLPELVDEKIIDVSLNNMETPWGMNFDQPSEVDRHWPWIDCHLARAYAMSEAPAKAFKYLKQWFRYASSNGASPEKIRLDGYAIGYWYPTPYALYLQALYASFAHIDPQGRLKLLYGFDGSWRDMAAKGLRLPGGGTVSLTVRDGKLVKLNLDGAAKSCPVMINPCYQ